MSERLDVETARKACSGLSNDGRDDAPWQARTLPKMHCWEIVDANGHNVATCMDTLSYRPIFIASARTLLPAALDEIGRLRALVVEACEIAELLAARIELQAGPRRSRLSTIRREAGGEGPHVTALAFVPDAKEKP